MSAKKIKKKAEGLVGANGQPVQTTGYLQQKDQQLDQQFHKALNTNPLATIAVGALHGLNCFLEEFERGIPPARSRITVYMFLGTFFRSIADEYLDRARKIEGFAELMEEMRGKANPGVPASEGDVSDISKQGA